MASLKVFSGNSNPALAEEICAYLGIPMGKAMVTRFSDGEIRVEINENVRGRDVFVVQSTSSPVNDHLMELLLLIDAFRRASADRITAVVPYYGYARQDRKVAPRVPITAKLVANLLTSSGASRVLTVDLHAGQIQGFFDIPVDNLYAKPVFLPYIAERFDGEQVVMVSPDAGGTERARAYAKNIGASLAMIDKRRTAPNVAEIMNVIGDVRDKVAVICDDMVDTAGTLTQAAKAIRENGAKAVFACCTHAVLSGPAVKRIEESPLQEIVVSNTIPLTDAAQACGKIKVVSLAPLIGDSIRRIQNNDSLSDLFV
ncbi:MAG: ribose-phosphate pyrophosphokinase [bacterium]